MEGTIRDSRMGLIRDSVEATISARGHDIGTRTDEQERREGGDALFTVERNSRYEFEERCTTSKKTRFDE